MITKPRVTLEEAQRALDGLPGGHGLNIAYEAVDRHAAGKLRDRLAVLWLARESARRDLTYCAPTGLPT
jgi:acetyl-CoA synthetase